MAGAKDDSHFVCVLAATLAGEAVLILGEVTQGLLRSLLEGLDITSRVLLASGDREAVVRLQARGVTDLRLSIHYQALDSLLDDISAHRFGMVVVTPEAVPVMEQALALLKPGGLIAGLAEVPPPRASAQLELADLHSDTLCWLGAVRKHPRARRRGARAARSRD